MGQQESKQKLDQITLSLNRIRKDVRNGKITANDVERIQEILKKYGQEVEGARNVRPGSLYTVEQLIEITSKELDGLIQEVNLDQWSVRTNSFSRASSKNYSKKEKRRSIKSITDSVQDIRQQVRNDKVQPADYDRLQSELVSYSQELGARRNKKTETEAAQKLISSVTEELLTKQQEIGDSGSIRRSTNSSLKRTSLTDKRSSLKVQEPKKEVPKIISRNSVNSLNDIEKKLETLKKDIKVAETNKDKSRLHFVSKSIQTLMTDLQMVNVNGQSVEEERKGLLEKNLQKVYQQVDKIKRQITEESDLKYLTELAKKEEKKKVLQDLEDIHKGLLAIGSNLSTQNFQAEKSNFNMFKTKFGAVEETDEEITSKKAEVSQVMLTTENAFTRLEMEERLNQAEWRHFQYKIDLKEFSGTSDGEVYKKHRQYLQQLKEYVGKVLDLNQKLDEKKKYVLYNIDNNIVALDQRAKENEEKSKEEKEEVVLRKPSPVKPTNKDVANNLVEHCKQIASLTPNELKEILPLLTEARIILDHKLGLFQNQEKVDGPVHLVTIKEKKLQSVTTSASPKFAETVTIREKVLPVLPPKPAHKESVQTDGEIVTVREKQLQVAHNSVPSVKTQIDNIQKEVETLQIQIENSRYTKETQLYKDIKNKLQSYKNQVRSLSLDNDNDKSVESLFKYIDNVLLFLESSLPSRRSTTEDILVDIMSVSTRVNDLGGKIHNFNHTTQDFDSIKSSLLENRNYLRNLQISSNRGNLYKSRDEILHQIEHHLSSLEDVKKNENNTVSEDEKRFNQDLRKIKEKVHRYSGTYKNVLYKTIENDLDKCLNKADKVFKDSTVVLKVRQDIENTKMILEQRSIKEQQISNVKHDARDSIRKELVEIRENVESVKRALSQIESLSKEEVDKLDARLTLSLLALDNIRDEHYREDKERLYQDIRPLFQKIQELMVVTRTTVSENRPKPQDHATMIANIERELEEIKPQILTFVGIETSSEFLHLDEVLVRGTLKLDELNVDQTSELYNAKIKLMREIHKYSDILDDRINQAEEMEKLEKEVKVILIKIDSFNGYFGDSEYMNLDEEIIRLKVNLGKLQVNQELLGRKEACIKEVDACMKKLNEAAKSRSSVLAGTLV